MSCGDLTDKKDLLSCIHGLGASIVDTGRGPIPLCSFSSFGRSLMIWRCVDRRNSESTGERTLSRRKLYVDREARPGVHESTEVRRALL